MTNRSGLSPDVQHSTTTVLERFPAAHPRGSWPAEEFDVQALADAGFRLAAPDSPATAAARYDIAAFEIGQKTRWMNTRDLTIAETAELRHARNTLRRAHATLARAGRLDLISGTIRLLAVKVEIA